MIMPEKAIRIRHKGIMKVYSEIGKNGALKLERNFFPSVDKPMAIEKLVFTNTGNQADKN